MSQDRTVQLWGLPNCDTVKKARCALQEAGWSVVFHDFKKEGASASDLERWCRALGWEAVLNRRGTTWRKLSPQQQAAAGDAFSAQALMQAQPSLIKRPVIEWPRGRVTVGAVPVPPAR